MFVCVSDIPCDSVAISVDDGLWTSPGLGWIWIRALVGPRSQASTAGHHVQDKEPVRIARVGIRQVWSDMLTGR